jgi:hypothetical protein
MGLREIIWNLDSQDDNFLIYGYYGVQKTITYYFIKGYNQALKDVKKALVGDD